MATSDYKNLIVEDVATETELALLNEPRLRLPLILAIAVPAAILFAIAVRPYELGPWIFITAGAGFAAFRFARERSILSDLGKAVGKVTEYNEVRGNSGKFVRVKYTFLSENHEAYLGRASFSLEAAPTQGQYLSILYNRNNPNTNLELSSFWFYDFPNKNPSLRFTPRA